MILLALLAAAATATPSTRMDFDQKGMIGLSFGLGPAPSLPGSTPNTTASTFAPVVGATYCINDGTAIRAELGFDGFLSSGAGPATLTLGVGMRLYQLKRHSVAVFLQPSVVLSRYRIITGGGFGFDAAEALTFAGGVGVEYLFTDRFSVGGVIAVGFTIGNIGGPTGSSTTTELNTSTSGLFASFYF
jgi:hypothetical protein